jgi:hypothetical protein
MTTTARALHRRKRESFESSPQVVNDVESASKCRPRRVHFSDNVGKNKELKIFLRMISRRKVSSLGYQQSEVLLTVMTVIWLIIQAASLSGRISIDQQPTRDNHYQIVFSWPSRVDVRLLHLHRMSYDEDERSPAYSSLQMYSLRDEPNFVRRIDPNDRINYEEYRSGILDDIDEEYFSDRWQPDADLEDKTRKCKRTNWRSTPHSNCNTVHELTVERPLPSSKDFDVKYLG